MLEDAWLAAADILKLTPESIGVAKFDLRNPQTGKWRPAIVSDFSKQHFVTFTIDCLPATKETQVLEIKAGKLWHCFVAPHRARSNPTFRCLFADASDVFVNTKILDEKIRKNSSEWIPARVLCTEGTQVYCSWGGHQSHECYWFDSINGEVSYISPFADITLKNNWPEFLDPRRPLSVPGDIQENVVLDVRDTMGKFCLAQVTDLDPKRNLCIVHYVGWDRKWDEIISTNDQHRFAHAETYSRDDKTKHEIYLDAFVWILHDPPERKDLWYKGWALEGWKSGTVVEIEKAQIRVEFYDTAGATRRYKWAHVALNEVRLYKEGIPTISELSKVLPDQTHGCVICLGGEKNMALVPCGHLCLCTTCAAMIPSAIHRCPLCRQNISSTLRIYHS